MTAKVDSMLREAGVLIEAGEDATHILTTLKAMLDEQDAADDGGTMTPRIATARHGGNGSSNGSNNNLMEQALAARAAKAAERAKKRVVRDVLREKRDELHRMLANCDAAISKGSSAPSSSSTTSVRTNSSRMSCSSSRAAKVAAGGASSFELKPPVIDPVDIMPPHLVEKFRQEYRAARAQQQQQQQHVPMRFSSDGPVAAAAARSSAAAYVGDELAPSTIEEFEAARGLAPKPLGKPSPNYRAMTHGRPKATFTAFAGAETYGANEAPLSPGGRRRVESARAAQSTLGALLAGQRPPSSAQAGK